MMDLSYLAAEGTEIRDELIQVDPQVELRVVTFIPGHLAEKPDVVFVAGWVSQMEAWTAVLREMTRDFRVIYMETREKISSQIQGKVNFNVESIGKDIVNLVEYFDLKENQYILFGSSLGATAIMDCVRFLNQKPLCLVLVGPNAVFRVPVIGKYIIKAFPPVFYLLIKPVVKWYLRHFRLDLKNDYAQYEKYSRALDAADPWKLKPAVLALSQYEIWPYLSFVECPTLILGAEKDKLHEPENLRKIVHSLSDCTYVDMHTNQGTHSAQVVVHINDYLQRIKVKS